jgi:hypothetical protein
VTILLKRKTAETIYTEFVKLKSVLENQTGKRIKIRSDGGGEFKGHLTEYLADCEIIHQTTNRYSSHQIGHVERMHGVILNMARAMLIHSRLPVLFFGDALLTAIFIYNRTVHGSDLKTPYELMFNKIPDISRLRPFGCICYAVIPQKLRHKQEPTAVKCRLIGYQDGITNGWKLLRESDWVIFTCNDVIFDENTEPTSLPDCDYDDTTQFIDNDECIIDDLDIHVDESDIKWMLKKQF